MLCTQVDRTLSEKMPMNVTAIALLMSRKIRAGDPLLQQTTSRIFPPGAVVVISYRVTGETIIVVHKALVIQSYQSQLATAASLWQAPESLLRSPFTQGIVLVIVPGCKWFYQQCKQELCRVFISSVRRL